MKLYCDCENPVYMDQTLSIKVIANFLSYDFKNDLISVTKHAVKRIEGLKLHLDMGDALELGIYCVDCGNLSKEDLRLLCEGCRELYKLPSTNSLGSTFYCGKCLELRENFFEEVNLEESLEIKKVANAFSRYIDEIIRENAANPTPSAEFIEEEYSDEDEGRPSYNILDVSF